MTKTYQKKEDRQDGKARGCLLTLIVISSAGFSLPLPCKVFFIQQRLQYAFVKYKMQI